MHGALDRPVPRPARALVACIVLAITITVFYRSSAFPPVDRSLSDAAIILLPLIGLILSIGRLMERRPSAVGMIIAVVFALSVALAGITSGPGSASIFGMLLPAMMAVVLVLVGSLLTAEEFQTVARWTILLAVVQVAIAVAEVQLLEPWARTIATPPNDIYPYRPNLVISGIGRANGAMGHPILLGLVCTIGAVLALSKQIVRRNPLRVAIIGALAWGVILSGSRSSLAAFGVAVAVFFLHPGSPTRRWVRVLIVMVVVPLTIIYIAEAVTTAREVSLFSLTNRLDAVPRLIETLNRPFPQWLVGEGVGFALDTVADNQFLTSSGAYGAVGLLSFGAAVVYGLFSRRPATAAAVACLAFMALSFDTLTWAFSTFMFWLLMGYGHSWSAASTFSSETVVPEPNSRNQAREKHPDRMAQQA